MKPVIAILLSLVFASNLWAETATLQDNAMVYEKTSNYSRPHELGRLPRGTRLKVYNDGTRLRGLGRAVLVERVFRPERIRSDYSYDIAMDINETSHYNSFYVLVRDIRAPRATRTNRRQTTQRFDHSREYEVCYEKPRSRVVRMNEEQRDRGQRNVVGGLIGAIGGQIIGGMTGNDDLGNVISAVGLGFAAVGAVQVASAKEVFYSDYDIDCQTYYKPDPRRYRFRRQGQSCTTTRYYTSRWGRTTEYFQTTCSGRQFVTFERSYEIYPY